jgi:hypothetical protein
MKFRQSGLCAFCEVVYDVRGNGKVHVADKAGSLFVATDKDDCDSCGSCCSALYPASLKLQASNYHPYTESDAPFWYC